MGPKIPTSVKMGLVLAVQKYKDILVGSFKGETGAVSTQFSITSLLRDL